MENIEFNAHVESVFSLMRTLVIKCEAIGIKDNRLLADSGYPVSDDKRRWRYYLNMSGEYHETDIPMYVTSIDNGETILFNKPNLDIHLATRRAYQPGSYWYKRLTEQYQGQVDLINGIMDPIDMDYAIAAEDYKILRYNHDLIEDNEDQLIPGLQRWINAYTQRHFINEYSYTENLQLPIDLAAMYGLMIPVVLTLRLEAYGTRNVSDYHVWNRLNSYGDFRRYRNGISHKQKMWLYRNIEYIRNNLGKNFTLEQLIENLLTPESIPIFHYRTLINTTDMTAGGSPEGLFIKERLNFKELEYDTGERYTNRDLLEIEKPLARDNALLLEHYATITDPESKESIHNDLSTKVLDSTMEDYTNRHADTLMKTLYHEWVYMTHHKLYDSIVDFVDPLNGNRIRLNTRDALIYWQLLTRKLRGEPVLAIDPFWFQTVMRKDLRSWDDFRGAAPNDWVTDYWVTNIRKQWLPTVKAISPDKFFDQCFEFHQRKWNTKKIYSQFDEYRLHAGVREIVSRLYDTGLYWLHDPKLYPDTETWLKEKELNLDQYHNTDLLQLSWDIFTKATGWDVNGIVSLRQIQSNLISLMEELSSYTIQFVKEIDDGNTTAENIDCLHLGITNLNRSSNVGDFLLPMQLPIDFHLKPDCHMDETIRYEDKNPLDHVALADMEGYLQADLILELEQQTNTHETIARINIGMGGREATWAY